MHPISESPIDQLPEAIRQVLTRFTAAARDSFGQDLISLVLFGSAAEGRLRAISDLNLLIILKRFDKARVDSFREPLRLAQVVAKASAMFLLESELAAAAEAFAVKFGDIARRHHVLYGDDVLAKLTPSREARKQQLRQVLLNLTLRLRERYATVSLREEQLVMVIAEAAGPLRAAAATLCELGGQTAGSPREALEIAAAIDGAEWPSAIKAISEARQSRSLPPGMAPGALFDLIRLCEALRARTEKLN
jgi:predicted nucleotidyltransferase